MVVITESKLIPKMFSNSSKSKTERTRKNKKETLFRLLELPKFRHPGAILPARSVI